MSGGIEFYIPFYQIICPAEVNREILFASVSHIISHRQPYYFAPRAKLFRSACHIVPFCQAYPFCRQTLKNARRRQKNSKKFWCFRFYYYFCRRCQTLKGRWASDFVGKQSRDVMSILVYWNLRNFKTNARWHRESPRDSVGWHHYIFVRKVFSGPQ